MRDLAPGLLAVGQSRPSGRCVSLADNFLKTIKLVGTRVQIKLFDNAAAAREWLEQIV